VKRLPKFAVPKKYDILLEPDLENEMFSGSTKISVEILEPTNKLVLNAKKLEIETISISIENKEYKCGWEVSDSQETITVKTDEDLSLGVIEIDIRYQANLTKDLVGFYISEYKDDKKTTHKIASTQFQAPHARRCFPCWDEPEFKAIFKMTVLIEEGLEAISNGMQVSKKTINDKTQI